ncbi:MAG TPA: ABC transporter ATP-binding protein [Candidatus Alectryocaccomicrobium excrementavium]|uniref:ABC transporter ATP-binding protein n=1 Tax=Candidatus Alectryocaccomicrobium excrementavium TaxID=2840668 RepID=A0A9D1K5U3_9FIRM|nr:ABC transporter ATP-binding protein [Candidatus Alectryocaccomicrobium excrementavium]
MEDAKQTARPQYGMGQNVLYMLRTAWRTRKSVIALCAAQALLSVASAAVGMFFAPAALGAIETGAPLARLLGIIGAFSLALLLLGALAAYASANTEFGRIQVRMELFSRTMHKSATTALANAENPAFQEKSAKANAAMNSNAAAAEAIWDTLRQILENALGFLLYLSLLTALDPLLVAVTLATSAAGFFSAHRILGWGYRHRREEEKPLKRMEYVLNQAKNTALGKDLRIFSMRPWIEEVFSSARRAYHSFHARAGKRYFLADAIDALLALARNGIAYAYLIAKTLSGELTVAEFLLYFSAISGFTTWVTGILSSFTTLHRQSLELSTIREFWAYPEPLPLEGGETPPALRPGDACALELRDVSFRYPGAEKDVLSHINLTIAPGEKLAIVGLNGAGKTTLVKLLCGFYDPTGGEVRLNGRNIRPYNRPAYQALLGAVYQNFSLVPASIAQNVAQDLESFDRARVQNCLERAGLGNKIRSLPHGMDTHLVKEVYEDAEELSGGELQRLMLARALYKDAPILVLDEPTAALDPIAESDIYQKYREMTVGRTSIYISHRLASTRFCDRILLLADGKIAEEGTHEALMAKGGEYARLFEIQSRYYREGGEDDGGSNASE